MDKGTRHVKPGGNATLLEDLVQNKDIWDDNLKGEMPMDGNGNVAANADAAAHINPKYYQESNFLLLGIPTSL